MNIKIKESNIFKGGKKLVTLKFAKENNHLIPRDMQNEDDNILGILEWIKIGNEGYYSFQAVTVDISQSSTGYLIKSE